LINSGLFEPARSRELPALSWPGLEDARKVDGYFRGEAWAADPASRGARAEWLVRLHSSSKAAQATPLVDSSVAKLAEQGKTDLYKEN
jgi:hypothetical protein